MVGIGLIGYGHWGPNHARAFQAPPESRVVAVADPDPARLDAARRALPGVRATGLGASICDDPGVDAVVIASPLSTHYDLARRALEAGKDVLVEKPICRSAAEADELIALADSRKLILMCGHVFLFNAGINRLRKYILDGELGRVYYMAATRTNLGPLRGDVNALYDLGSHDVSIFHHLLGTRPTEVAAWGHAYLQPGVEDVTFACLEYPGDTLCQMHVSWLNPRKERTLVVVGDRKMAVWDDTNPIEALRIYDKGMMADPYYDSFGHFQLVIRDADILIPKLAAEEPLRAQARHFLGCVRERDRPVADGAFARDVVAALEALQRSLRNRGSREKVADGSADAG